VLESHVSYPMLSLFRSQHVGQSCITALGVVTDAAALACACATGADVRQPSFMHRPGRRAVIDIAARHNQKPTGFWWHSAEAGVADEVARATAEARDRARGLSR
jgi:hypothetical protein